MHSVACTSREIAKMHFVACTSTEVVRRCFVACTSREVARRCFVACRCKGAGRAGHSSSETCMTVLVTHRLIFMSFQVVPSCSKLNTSTGTLCRLCLRRMTDVIVSVCIIVCIMCMYRHEAHYTSVLLVQPLMANLHAAAPGMCILNATNACRQVHCFHCECYM